MTAAQYVKSRGVKSLRLVSEKTGVSEQTLGNWWKSKQSLFKVVVEGVRSKMDFEKVAGMGDLSKFEVLLDNWNAEIYIQAVRYGGDGRNCYAMLIHDRTPEKEKCAEEFFGLVGGDMDWDYAERFLRGNSETYLVQGKNAHDALKNLEIEVNKSE